MADSSQIAGFKAEEVRAGLRLAMQVGLPVQSMDRPVFFMPAVVTSSDVLDGEGVPFDPAATVSRVQSQVRDVPCAVEYRDGEGKLENFGVIVPAKVVLVLLDEDYVRIKGFDFVAIGGTKYFYRRTEVPKALVSVGVYKIHCVSEDEG